MSRARTFRVTRISRRRMRSRSTSGGSLRNTGRLAKSCRCDGSTPHKPRGAGRSINNRKPSPQVQMRCCLTRWAVRDNGLSRGQQKEKRFMATQTQTAPQSDSGAQKIQQLRELFADASDVGKRALENVIKELSSQVSEPPPPIESAGRVGARLGKRSELTMIVPLVPGGAKRLRTFLQLLGGNLSPGATKVGTLHDMRFVFIDNDTRLLFATSFDGDWDNYIDDFIALIPDYLDLMDSAWEGWPGIRDPGAKDYLIKHQITAEGWFVANPELTLAEIQRLQRLGKATDEFLDKINP